MEKVKSIKKIGSSGIFEFIEGERKVRRDRVEDLCRECGGGGGDWAVAGGRGHVGECDRGGTAGDFGDRWGTGAVDWADRTSSGRRRAAGAGDLQRLGWDRDVC